MEAGQETEYHSDEYAKADQRTGMLKPAFMMERVSMERAGGDQRKREEAGKEHHRNPKR